MTGRAGDVSVRDAVMAAMPYDEPMTITAVLTALRSLPVEQRMEAMGMVEVAANLPKGYRRWAEADA